MILIADLYFDLREDLDSFPLIYFQNILSLLVTAWIYDQVGPLAKYGQPTNILITVSAKYFYPFQTNCFTLFVSLK